VLLLGVAFVFVVVASLYEAMFRSEESESL
jgi:hypothetical protein